MQSRSSIILLAVCASLTLGMGGCRQNGPDTEVCLYSAEFGTGFCETRKRGQYERQIQDKDVFTSYDDYIDRLNWAKANCDLDQ